VKIAVLGTGVVGQTLAAKFAELGHQTVIGTRDPDASKARTEIDRFGRPGFGTWVEEHADVDVVTLDVAAARSDVVVNATNGEGSVAAITDAGASNLAGKVLVDVSNPLDFAGGFPPSLFVKDTDSLAEQIQRAVPAARVVKSLNTMTAAVMVDPARVGAGDHSVFVSGDDPEAKRTVVSLLEDLGHTDVIDLGDLATARGVEMYLPLWLRMMGAVGTPFFNIKVVR
jgi:8-hydroxy-5-deazaflavin:NADPH oxidoreductase